LRLPLIAFAESGPALGSAPLMLRGYELIESGDHGGTLRLTLNAQDSVGLLGSLLAAFSSLSLLPVEMHIETRDAEACDCLWLATTSSGKPGAKDKAALDALLTRTLEQ
jgi:UTP:GlnB (protein PII) uridylyltransferase